MASYSLRPVSVADYDFLFALHRMVMREYIEPIWGWHEEWQAEYFRRKFDIINRWVIQVDQIDVGVLVLEEHPDELYLSLIEILPEYQNQGIGSSIICDLIRRAKGNDMPLSLHVLKTNLRARQLYENLGFKLSGEEERRFKFTVRAA